MVNLSDREYKLALSEGFFAWGKGAWIHEDDLGWVMDTEQMLEELTQRVQFTCAGCDKVFTSTERDYLCKECRG